MQHESNSGSGKFMLSEKETTNTEFRYKVILLPCECAHSFMARSNYSAWPFLFASYLLRIWKKNEKTKNSLILGSCYTYTHFLHLDMVTFASQFLFLIIFL